MEFTISTKRLFRKIFAVLVIIETALVFADVFLNHFRWIPSRALRKVFNITREDSLANWFASAQTFAIGLVILLIARLSDTHKKTWAFFGCFFVYLGLDDASKFHERFGTAMKGWASDGGTFAYLMKIFPSYSWQIVLGPFYVIVGIALLVFIWRQYANMKLRIKIVLALSCLAVAMGIDYVEGMELEFISQHFVKAMEEYIEMIGMSFFLATFVQYTFMRWNKIQINSVP